MIKMILAVIIAFFILQHCGYVHAATGVSAGPPNLAYYAIGKDMKAACPDLDINVFESKGGMSNLGNMTMRNDVTVGIAPLDSIKFFARTNQGKANRIGVIA